MNKQLLSLVAVLLLLPLAPAKATLINGTFSGVVTGTSGAFPFANGASVTGSFGFDSNFFRADSSGKFYTSLQDSSLFFNVFIAGQQLYGWTPQSGGLSIVMDSDGIPISGGAGGAWDLFIGAGGLLNFGGLNNSGQAQVAYSIPAVPDAGATSTLLGVALAGLAVGRRFLR